MKKSYLILCLLAIYSLSSFKTSKACEYAGSNIGYINTQTKKALKAENLNKAKYYAYKALNAIEKSKKQLRDCGCKYASKSIFEGLENLKKATRATSLNSSRLLLKRALHNSVGSIDALEEHEQHDTAYDNDVLVMNTTETTIKRNSVNEQLKGKLLQQKIDKSLVNFEKSLNTVVNSINCREAYDFAYNIYRICEKELLEGNLSEAKKYYNLRTKVIVENALIKLEHCSKE